MLSAVGNIMVCIAIYTERSLRRIGNLFLASLAIADLFVSLLVMTFAGVNDILGECFIPNRIQLKYFHLLFGFKIEHKIVCCWLNFQSLNTTGSKAY